MPTAFAFSDQRFRRWMASEQSPVFIPTLSAFLFFWTFGGAVALRAKTYFKENKTLLIDKCQTGI